MAHRPDRFDICPGGFCPHYRGLSLCLGDKPRQRAGGAGCMRPYFCKEGISSVSPPALIEGYCLSHGMLFVCCTDDEALRRYVCRETKSACNPWAPFLKPKPRVEGNPHQANSPADPPRRSPAPLLFVCLGLGLACSPGLSGGQPSPLRCSPSSRSSFLCCGGSRTARCRSPGCRRPTGVGERYAGERT